MKLHTTTFLCDESRCPATFHAVGSGEDRQTEAYLELAEAGWQIQRPYGGWKHRCPEHRIEGKKP